MNDVRNLKGGSPKSRESKGGYSINQLPNVDKAQRGSKNRQFLRTPSSVSENATRRAILSCAIPAHFSDVYFGYVPRVLVFAHNGTEDNNDGSVGWRCRWCPVNNE